MNEQLSNRLALARVFSTACARAAERAKEINQPVYLALYTDDGQREITGTEAMPRQEMQRGFSGYPNGAHAPNGLRFPPWRGGYPVVITHARLWTASIGGAPSRFQVGDGSLVQGPLAKFTHTAVVRPDEAFAMPAGSGVGISSWPNELR